MSTSPTPAQLRRQEQVLTIQEQAISLTLERGFDGFTMDELAERVGISRKTLFNRVGDKMSAVLGPNAGDGLPPNVDELLDLGTTPLESLVQAVLVVGAAAGEDDRAAGLQDRLRQVAQAEPRLDHEARRRFRQQLSAIAERVREREGWDPDDPRPSVLLRVFGELLDEAVDRRLASHRAGRSTRLVDEFQTVVAAYRAVALPAEAPHA